MSRATTPVVVITGASSGIGRETARLYAKKGARLVLASRSKDALETVAEECRALGAMALVVPTDVSHEGQVRALAAAAHSEYGRIDVWVGNAGVFAYGAFEHLPSKVFRQVLETNLMGQVHGARAVLPYFRRQGSGALVLVGSLYSRVGSPGDLAVRHEQMGAARLRRVSAARASRHRHPCAGRPSGNDRHPDLPARRQRHDAAGAPAASGVVARAGGPSDHEGAAPAAPCCVRRAVADGRTSGASLCTARLRRDGGVADGQRGNCVARAPT